MHRYLVTLLHKIDNLVNFGLFIEVKSVSKSQVVLVFGSTYEIDPWMNTLCVEIERKSDEIYVARSFSVAKQCALNTICLEVGLIT